VATEEPTAEPTVEPTVAATEEPTPESVAVLLNPVNESGITGTALLTADGDSTTVAIQVVGAAGDHPVHIHAGTCSSLGDVIEPLEDINASGQSTSTVDISLDTLLSGEYAINAHESAAAIQNYVACGNVAVNS